MNLIRGKGRGPIPAGPAAAGRSTAQALSTGIRRAVRPTAADPLMARVRAAGLPAEDLLRVVRHPALVRLLTTGGRSAAAKPPAAVHRPPAAGALAVPPALAAAKAAATANRYLSSTPRVP